MYPILYNGSNNKLAILNNIVKESDRIKRSINGEFTFQFKAVESELKSEYFDVANYVFVDDQCFDIKYIEQSHSNPEVMYDIQCEHVSYRLLDGVANVVESYSMTGTPTAILDDILLGTEFVSGTVEYSTPMTLIVNEEITRKGLIFELADALGAEVDYSNNGFTIDLLNSIGADNGYIVKLGKNLKGVTKVIDNRGELKTHYTIDIVELKNSMDYVSKGLENFEVIEVGDTIRIIDEVIGLDISPKIISLEYSPTLRMNTAIEISNTIELLSDDIKRIDTEKLKSDGIYNGVKIGPDEGIVVTRSDGKAKIMMNATEGLSIWSDSGSGLEKIFYVDAAGVIQATNINITP